MEPKIFKHNSKGDNGINIYTIEKQGDKCVITGTCQDIKAGDILESHVGIGEINHRPVSKV